MPPLTPEDLAFLRNESTYASGPTLDFYWCPVDTAKLSALRDALLNDGSISTDPPLRPRHADDHPRVVWSPNDLPPIALALSNPHRFDDEAHAYIYPAHVERATGESYYSWNAPTAPRMLTLFAAAIALTRRLHRRVPLLSASIIDETYAHTASETGVIAIPRPLAESANWPHSLARDESSRTPPREPLLALLPLDG